MATTCSEGNGEPFFVIERGDGELELSFSGEVIEIVAPTFIDGAELEGFEERVCNR
jgi:hypothetical protein